MSPLRPLKYGLSKLASDRPAGGARFGLEPAPHLEPAGQLAREASAGADEGLLRPSRPQPWAVITTKSIRWPRADLRGCRRGPLRSRGCGWPAGRSGAGGRAKVGGGGQFEASTTRPASRNCRSTISATIRPNKRARRARKQRCGPSNCFVKGPAPTVGAGRPVDRVAWLTGQSDGKRQTNKQKHLWDVPFGRQIRPPARAGGGLRRAKLKRITACAKCSGPLGDTRSANPGGGRPPEP